MMNNKFFYLRWDGEYFIFHNCADYLMSVDTAILDCYFTEYVSCPPDIILIVDDIGAKKSSCPPNFLASAFYPGAMHGNLIYGNVIIAKKATDPRDGITGFNSSEAELIRAFLSNP